MKILLLCEKWDEDHLDSFQRLPTLVGHQLVKSSGVYENPVTLDRLCDKHSIEAVVCSQQAAMETVLNDTKDFLRGNSRKQLTLDNYAGSMLQLRSGRDFLVVNPLERLKTVPYEKFVVNRYVSKLTKPNAWFPQTEFLWEKVTFDNRDAVLQRIAAGTLCAIDIETPWPANPLREMECVSYTVYDKANHTTHSFVVEFNEEWHWEFIRDANATSVPKVFQNGLFDNTYFLRWGAPCNNWIFDTYHLFHCWLAELPKRLDFITAFAIRRVRYWKDDNKTGNLIDFHRYCAKDGWATINSLLALLHEAPAWALTNYAEHEFPLVFPCLHAALEGLEGDVERFTKIAEEKEKEVDALRERLRYLLSEPTYNPGSWQQNEKLFLLLGVGHIKGTGKIPTLKASAVHPLNAFTLALVEEYKAERKQYGTYFDSSKFWDGRIYYSIDPGGTDTGRAASRESAFDCGWQIQNVPARDDSFKQCVLAPQGWYIAEIDKKQSEARCVAYLSGDENLLALVESPHDYHSWNASKFFGIPYEKIYDEAKEKTLDKPLRDLSKRTNHGANYNMGAEVMLDTMGPKKVAQAKIQLKLPSTFTLKKVCQYLLDRYEATYPVVKGRWYESIVQAIETTKKLVSPFGWVRLFHGTPRHNKLHLNSAVAHAPQNLSVAIINREWLIIWRETVYGSLRGRVRIKAQIHDSLLFIYRSIQDAEAVQALMNLRVPVKDSGGVTRTMFIPCDLSTGKQPTRRWSEIK